jgi:hypothetical protein
MSDYDLSLTGAQIDAALSKVHNADVTPTNGSQNMVTSDAVHDAVNDIQFANLNSNLVSTDLSSGNNNITVPTTQAVVNHVNTNSYVAANNVAYFTAADGSRNSNGNIGSWTEVSDPGNFCSINGSLIEIAGDTICTVIYSGRFDRSSSNQDYDYHFQLYTTGTNGGHVATPTNSGEIPHNFGNGYYFSHTSGFNKKGDNTVAYAGIYINDRASSGNVAYQDVAITVIKHL